MNYAIVAVALAAVAALVFLVLPRMGRRDADRRGIAPDRLKALLDKGAVTVVDVREPDEFARGHIPGAVSLPLGGLRDGLKNLPGDRAIAAVCQRGRRSRAAAGLIARVGFNEVYSLEGGMASWPYGTERAGEEGR